ncbi:Rieske (2Fe-2S) protein [Nocardioides limicola]|uniref:Rieske (2Fe-2S) protein n=1 Tax=Nocardioides limicola TaxID=2803368 RepID=UPI00193B9D37|nr:Rieske (2Fe-2S) protein [Nocardioides sp. DJM-14]
MPERIRIGSVDDFADEQLHTVEVKGTSVVVGRAGGEVCAAKNRCPHLGLPLNKGPGGVQYDGGQVTCPWHNSRFDLATGENLDWTPGFAGMKVPRWSSKLIAMGKKPAPLDTYRVVIDGDDVYVEV